MRAYQIPGVRVIGITGRARSGKDELAKVIVREAVLGHDAPFIAERFALSDGVSVVARVSCGMRARDPHTLQTVGTAERHLNESVWLDVLFGTIEDRRPSLAVITGVRYPNEAAMIRAMGGVLIGVVRPEAPPVVDRDPHHPVEMGINEVLSGADAIIINREQRDETVRYASLRCGASLALEDLLRY